jgi:hypothetical protein
MPVRLRSGARLDAIAGDGAGGSFFLCGEGDEERPVLYASSEGEAGHAAQLGQPGPVDPWALPRARQASVSARASASASCPSERQRACQRLPFAGRRRADGRPRPGSGQQRTARRRPGGCVQPPGGLTRATGVAAVGGCTRATMLPGHPDGMSPERANLFRPHEPRTHPYASDARQRPGETPVRTALSPRYLISGSWPAATPDG